jgi:ligand-binding SRPBCC domain-containing protein
VKAGAHHIIYPLPCNIFFEYFRFSRTIHRVTVHLFEAQIWLPAPLTQVFPFFSDARNLEVLTPPWLNFEILTPGQIPMHPGALIDYRLRVHGVPVRWRTEITEWNPPHGFVDEQRRGPYRLWRHRHTFEEREGGTLCGDRVEYAVPGGALINWLLVRRDVQTIFKYRAEALRKQFPAGAVAQAQASV